MHGVPLPALLILRLRVTLHPGSGKLATAIQQSLALAARASHKIGICGQKLQDIVQIPALGVCREKVRDALVKFGSLLANNREAGAILCYRVGDNGEFELVWRREFHLSALTSFALVHQYHSYLYRLFPLNLRQNFPFARIQLLDRSAQLLYPQLLLADALLPYSQLLDIGLCTRFEPVCVLGDHPSLDVLWVLAPTVFGSLQDVFGFGLTHDGLEVLNILDSNRGRLRHGLVEDGRGGV